MCFVNLCNNERKFANLFNLLEDIDQKIHFLIYIFHNLIMIYFFKILKYYINPSFQNIKIT